MSRYVKRNDNIEFVYGYDHALGYFYEVWDNFNLFHITSDDK